MRYMGEIWIKAFPKGIYANMSATVEEELWTRHTDPTFHTDKLRHPHIIFMLIIFKHKIAVFIWKLSFFYIWREGRWANM